MSPTVTVSVAESASAIRNALVRLLGAAHGGRPYVVIEDSDPARPIQILGSVLHPLTIEVSGESLTREEWFRVIDILDPSNRRRCESLQLACVTYGTDPDPVVRVVIDLLRRGLSLPDGARISVVEHARPNDIDRTGEGRTDDDA